MTTYTAYRHQDGSGIEALHTGLTLDEAKGFLADKARQFGQPIGLEWIVNESDEYGCAYYAIDEED